MIHPHLDLQLNIAARTRIAVSLRNWHLSFALCFTLFLLGPLATIRAAVIVFGDSLSDVGNLSLTFGGLIPFSPPYDGGRFTNGPVWAEVLAERLNLPVPTPSLSGGTDFAYVGARVLGASQYTNVDLTAQVANYLNGGGVPAPTDIFTVWGGSNDFLSAANGQIPPITPQTVVANLEAVITNLANAGAKTFVVGNLPPLGQTPQYRGKALSAQLDAATSAYNLALADKLPLLSGSLGVTIHPLDANALFLSAISNPAAYGLTNVTDSATLLDATFGIGYALATSTPEKYLFFDSVHPTSTVHQIMGKRAADLVLGVPEPGGMMLVLLVLCGEVGRRFALRNRI